MKYKIGYYLGVIFINILFFYGLFNLFVDIKNGESVLLDLSFLFILAAWRNVNKIIYFNNISYLSLHDKLLEIEQKIVK